MRNYGGNLSDEQIKFAQTILSSGNDLLTLINDILDLSKIESGELEFSAVMSEEDVVRLVERQAATVAGRIPARYSRAFSACRHCAHRSDCDRPTDC